MQLSRYIKAYPCPDQPGRTLLYSTKRSSLIVIPDQLLDAARTGDIDAPHRETLSRLGFIVSDPDAERREMSELFVNANKNRPIFNAIVVLNLDCNLACGYCYEDNFRGNFYMSGATANLLVDSVVHGQMEHGRDVAISFYGGEPLLSIGLIKDISARLGAAARDRGVKFSFSMITNGTLLTRNVVEELLPFGFTGAKVTIDGPRETHDASRPFTSGSGSFDAIVANLSRISGLIKLHLGGNFTQDNYPIFPSVLDELTRHGITPENVERVLFVPVVQKSGEKAAYDLSSTCACSYEPWLIEASVYLREETLKRGFPTPKIQMSACMVEYDSDIVVNYDGALFKCPAFMAYDSLRIGNLSDGIRDYRESHNMDVWKNERCLECPYLPICFGGCRHMTLSRTAAINEVDCRKEFYDKALESLIRQEMKYLSKKG